VIDAHQHFWELSRDDYGWLSPDDAVLYRDFQPGDLAPHLERAGITKTVLVQAAPTVEETRYLLGVAERAEFVAAVVGWVDLPSPAVARDLDGLVGHPVFRGVRPMIQEIADDEWMLSSELTPGFEALIARDLCFDALVLPRHLSPLQRLLDRHPDLRVVVDHAAKPAIATRRFDEWARDIARVARETGAFCKFSGLATEAASDWSAADLHPYVAHLLDCFGSDRLMWGSDWPVIEVAGGFSRWRQVSQELLRDLGAAERGAIFGDTAARFYRIEME
jgi:L-fuconolactonase